VSNVIVFPPKNLKNIVGTRYNPPNIIENMNFALARLILVSISSKLKVVSLSVKDKAVFYPNFKIIV
jgi:hypothetical protein